MKKSIAERKLLYSLKGGDTRKEIVVRIDAPYIVDQNKVDFQVGEGLIGCHIEVAGLMEEYHHDVYGVDELQAINMASDVEPLLKRISKKYDLYWLDGEPYFEST